MLRRIRRCAALLAVAVAFCCALAGGESQAAYPERPVTLVVPWGAGGGTDATARIIGSLLERELGQPFNVVNRTGGSGVVGHSAIATAAPDGYTIGLITVEIGMMHWQGLTELDYRSYTPLALVNEDPAGFQVRADSPYKSVKDVLAAVKANPGKIKASGTGQGGIWHLALAGMLQSLGMDPASVPWVPSQGAAPAMQDLAAGGIDVVSCSVPEARSMLDANRARSLAVMSTKRNPIFPNVPTLKEATGSDWQMAAWRGMAGPKGMPKDAVDRLASALKRVYDSKEYQEFMAGRGFGVIYGNPQEFAAFMAKSDEDLGKVMKSVGIAK
jgi:tripartite-type tricarboxylate transporter receptor subunit TctC